MRATSAPHAHLRGRLVAVGVVTALVAVLCAVLAYILERHGKQTEIHTLWDAFFWTSTQLLTVSSQLKNPVTTGGQILDIFMEAYAITVVATLAGSFGAFFHHRSQQRSAP
jgi:drug/metabolite transporter (DMT)-like permease